MFLPGGQSADRKIRMYSIGKIDAWKFAQPGGEP